MLTAALNPSVLTMGTYLKEFADRVADVPGYLRRHMALIKDLDEKAVALQQEIEQYSKRKLLTGKSPQSKRQKTHEHEYDVDSAVTRLLSLADEKASPGVFPP